MVYIGPNPTWTWLVPLHRICPSGYYLRSDTISGARLKGVADDHALANGDDIDVQRVVDQVHVVFDWKWSVYSVDGAWERGIRYAERRLPNLRFGASATRLQRVLEAYHSKFREDRRDLRRIGTGVKKDHETTSACDHTSQRRPIVAFYRHIGRARSICEFR